MILTMLARARSVFALLISVIAVMGGCRHEKDISTGSLDIVFKGTFGGTPLYMFENSYDYPEDMQIKWQLFEFFLSDLEILSSQSTAEAAVLSPVELISFGEVFDAATAEEGIRLTFSDIPAGDYGQLRFGLGVAPDLNQTRPSDYSVTEPLGQVAGYWEAASSYIYTKIEGNADLDGDGQFGEQEEKLTFHLGASELYELRSLPVSVSIRPGQTARLVIDVDLRKALVDGSGNFIDFRQTPKDHHNNPQVYEFVLTHLRDDAIGISN